MIVNRKGNLPELEIFGSNVIKMRGIFLLDHFFEDTNIVGLRNLDSEHNATSLQTAPHRISASSFFKSSMLASKGFSTPAFSRRHSQTIWKKLRIVTYHKPLGRNHQWHRNTKSTILIPSGFIVMPTELPFWIVDLHSQCKAPVSGLDRVRTHRMSAISGSLTSF